MGVGIHPQIHILIRFRSTTYTKNKDRLGLYISLRTEITHNEESHSFFFLYVKYTDMKIQTYGNYYVDT